MKNIFIKKSPLNRLLIFFFTLSLAFLLLSGISSCAGSGVYTLEDNGDTIQLGQGDAMTLKLESNPTTGYGWILTDDMDDTVIALTSTEYKQAKTEEKMVGSGGYEYFYFKARAPGSTAVILNYERPWEEGVEPIDTFSLSVVVK